MSGPPFSGGCQCGAVRFRADAPARDASLCHCRMCQKATGGPFGPYVGFPAAAVTWTRGQRKLFLSSEHIARGFCGDCGTPLTFEAASGQGRSVGLTIGSFDDPALFAPGQQIMVAERIPWVADIASIPCASAEEDAAGLAKYPPVISRQHPDYDTEAWPPAR